MYVYDFSKSVQFSAGRSTLLYNTGVLRYAKYCTYLVPLLKKGICITARQTIFPILIKTVLYCTNTLSRSQDLEALSRQFPHRGTPIPIEQLFKDGRHRLNACRPRRRVGARYIPCPTRHAPLPCLAAHLPRLGYRLRDVGERMRAHPSSIQGQQAQVTHRGPRAGPTGYGRAAVQAPSRAVCAHCASGRLKLSAKCAAAAGACRALYAAPGQVHSVMRPYSSVLV